MKTIRFARLCCSTFTWLLVRGALLQAQPIIPANEPADQTALTGGMATFSVSATGTLPLAYQWRRYTNTIAYGEIPGATNTVLVLTNAQATIHRFAVAVSDSTGSRTSRLARLTAVPLPTIEPANPTAALYADLRLTSTVTAAGPVSYQWWFNGAPMAGATTNTLSVTNIQKANAGDYVLVVNYAFGSATSQLARLSIVPFSSIYCFGFSYTDTHNCTWPSPSYWANHPSNGPMWPEFLSTNLGLAYVESNNYAHCGSSLLAQSQANSFRPPPKPELSLYCLWLLSALTTSDAESTWDQIIQNDILISSNTVNQLYAKGARTILIEGQFEGPLALRAFGTNTALRSRYQEQWPRLNAGFLAVMSAYSRSKADLRILFVDFASRQDAVVANPARFGFTKADLSALEDMSLTDKSFTGPGADYLFWDSVGHPTSKFHHLLAAWHWEALTNSVLEKLEVKLANGSATIGLSHLLIGRDYTVQKSSDLSSWDDVQFFTASAGTNQVLPALEAGARSTFYRLRWQP